MSPEGSGTPGRLTSLGTPCVSLPLRAEKTPLPHPDSGLIGAPSPSSPSVLSRTSPPGSQKGCRRQGWHTAGWVGAGSQLGPAGRDLGAQLAPGASGGPHRGLFEIACGSKNRTVGATLLSQHLIQILKSTLPGPAPCRDRAGPTPPPPECSLVWSRRHPHVAGLPRIEWHEWEYELTPSPRTEKSQPSCPQEAGASHLKGVVKFAGLGERVPTVSVVSHICTAA